MVSWLRFRLAAFHSSFQLPQVHRVEGKKKRKAAKDDSSLMPPP